MNQSVFTHFCHLFLFLSLFLGLSLNFQNLNANAINHPSAVALLASVNESLFESSDPSGPSFQAIKQVQNNFYTLPRHFIENAELQEIKYLMQHWRLQLKNSLLQNIYKNESVEDSQIQINNFLKLQQLDVRLTPEELTQIRDRLQIIPNTTTWKPSHPIPLPLYRAFVRLVQSQGSSLLTRKIINYNPSSAYDGPKVTLPIKPIEPSDWPYSKWSQDLSFSDYERDQLGRVFYRGHHFEPGDVVVVNQMVDLEGTFSVFMGGPASYTHSGVYVEMSKNGVRFPTIFEIHKLGVRFVPLNVFFGSNFISYAEIYRANTNADNNGNSSWSEKMEDSARKMASTPHAYNFYGTDEYTKNGYYLTCTQLVKFALIGAGYPMSTPLCAVTDQAHKTLSKLDFFATKILTPTGFARDSQLTLVGTFDSGVLSQNLVKELILYRLNININTKEIDINALASSWIYQFVKLNWEGKIPILSPIITKLVSGFTTETMPIGPASTVAMVIPLDKATKASFQKTRMAMTRSIENAIAQTTPFSFYDFYNSNDTQNRLKNIPSPFDEYISDKIN